MNLHDMLVSSLLKMYNCKPHLLATTAGVVYVQLPDVYVDERGVEMPFHKPVETKFRKYVN